MDHETIPNLVDNLVQAASGIFLATMKYSEHSGAFRGLFTLNISGTPKPVLVVGTAHGVPNEDGGFIAVLNPDHELAERLHVNCSYAGGLLKEIVAGKCDAMVEVWIETYRNDKTKVLSKYLARTQSDAKFKVQ